MRYPGFIKENDRIGFIAPSFGCTLDWYRTRLGSALEYFKGEGYSLVTGPNVYKEDGIGKSTNAKDCGLEINDFFTNDKSDCIISVGGGETMCEDLGYVDFEAIAKASPKWFMGYSDNTNLTFTLPTLCDTAAVYGPCASSFGMRPMHKYLTDAMSLLSGKNLKFSNYDKWELEKDADEENPLVTVNATEAYCQKVYTGGKLYTKDACPEINITGRILGGCLDLLCCLCGTKYDKVKEFNEKYKEDGTFWFFESCDLEPLSVFRAVWQLDSAGWFDTAKGFMVGRPLHFNAETMGMDNYLAVTQVLEKHNVPIIFDTDLGHLPPQIPVISGAIGKLHALGNDLSIEYELR